jgi:hypothetical protein
MKNVLRPFHGIRILRELRERTGPKKITSESTTIFVYNVAGQLVAEYTNLVPAPSTWAGMSHLTTDHLGTPRVITKADGSVISRHDYLPFGEEVFAGVGGRNSITRRFNNIAENWPIVARIKTPKEPANYSIGVFNCDDGCKAYVNGALVTETGFGEASGLIDVTQQVSKRRSNQLRFEVLIKVGAIAYGFQVWRNGELLFDRQCGKAFVVGCVEQTNFSHRCGPAV